jgi:carbonic anhydrase/acetyltransferase-like protein (isoleucine patch superfamily)
MSAHDAPRAPDNAARAAQIPLGTERRGPPVAAATAFIHPRASVCGSVTIAEAVSVWGGAVIRGDADPITIGHGSNIQDLTMVHTDLGIPTSIGANVTVGHRAILHGCQIEDSVLIGMGAILLNRCRIGSGSIIGAGALIPEGVQIPPNSLVLGMPGKVVRDTTPEERERIIRSAEGYQRLAQAHAEGRVIYHGGS